MFIFSHSIIWTLMSNIKWVLDEKDFIQTWLTEQLSRNYNIVNEYRNNRRHPRLDTLHQIGIIFKCGCSKFNTKQ